MRQSLFYLSVQQFDPSLGTLLAVDFDFSDSQSGQWSVNGDLTPGFLTIESSASSDLPLNVIASSDYFLAPLVLPAHVPVQLRTS